MQKFGLKEAVVKTREVLKARNSALTGEGPDGPPRESAHTRPNGSRCKTLNAESYAVARVSGP